MSSEEDNWGDYVEDSDEEDDQQSDEEVELENMFYEAEDLKTEDYRKAIEQYQLVISMEEQKEEKKWTPKSIIEIIKIKLQKNDFEDFESDIRKMLGYMALMSNFEQRSTVDNIISSLGKIGAADRQLTILETLANYLEEKGMSDLWLNTSQRLARLYLQLENEKRFLEIISSIKKSSFYKEISQGEDQIKRASLMGEITSIEIQYFLSKGDTDSIRNLSEGSHNISELCGNDPKVLGSLKEAEAKLLME